MKSLVRFEASYVVKSRIFSALDEGTVVLSLQKSDDLLEFWIIRWKEPADDVEESGATYENVPQTSH